MHSSFQKLFDQIESQRESVLSPFRNLSTEQFNKEPGTGGWSAAAVLNHMVTAERLSVLYMNKKVEGIHNASTTGLREFLKMGVFIASQRLPGLKYKAPKHVVQNTTALTSLEEIENAWNEVRKNLRALLERIPADQVNRMIYKHPLVGYLDARHALVFFREHTIHHKRQLRRLLSPRL